MDGIRKMAGLVWMALAPAALGLLLYAAFKNINGAAKGDITNPVPWIIVIAIFTPIVIGLVIFGWYCWNGEYNQAKQESNDKAAL